MTSSSKPDYQVRMLRPHDFEGANDAWHKAWSRDEVQPRNFVQKLTWFYSGNPAGPAQVHVLACGNDTVGMVVMSPRRVLLSGSEVTAFLSCDLVVRADHRTALPALFLQRAAQSAALATAAYTYALPNLRAAPIFKRLGGTLQLSRPRLTRIVRHGTVLRRWLPILLAVPLGWLADFAVGLVGLRHRWRGRSWRVSWCDSFDESFDVLWEEIMRRAGLCKPPLCIGVRDAAFLRWRFGNELGRDNRTLAVRGDDGRLLAYLVGEWVGAQFHVRDFLSSLSGKQLIAALTLMARELYRLGCGTLSIRLLAGPETCAAFRGAGFYRRESESIVVRPSNWAADSVRASACYLTIADEDV